MNNCATCLVIQAMEPGELCMSCRTQKAIKYLKDNYDKITICPYCGDEPIGRLSCCGESSCHFEEAYVDDDNEIIDVDEFVKNFNYKGEHK